MNKLWKPGFLARLFGWSHGPASGSEDKVATPLPGGPAASPEVGPQEERKRGTRKKGRPDHVRGTKSQRSATSRSRKAGDRPIAPPPTPQPP